jgi:hypothetical protein
MKLKEYPFSIFHSLRLRYTKQIPNHQLQVPVIISLTSIPSRLIILDIVIASLLRQATQAQLIVLWLNDSLRGDLPRRLEKLQGDNFKIRYCEGTSSFRKLLPSLRAYSDSVIVTCDDDMIYPENWLKNLYDCHLEHQDCVISQVGRLIERSSNGMLKSYKSWPFVRHECSGNNLLPIGYGGVLYPLGTFDERVFEGGIYNKLTPKADDLWFKAMAFLNGKTTYCASEKARPIPILRSQKIALNTTNIHNDGNRSQWQALCEYYPVLSDL